MHRICMVGEISSNFTSTYTKNGLSKVKFSCFPKLDTKSQSTFSNNKDKHIKTIHYNMIVNDDYYSQYLLDNARVGSDIYIIGRLSHYIEETSENTNMLEVDVEIISLLPDMQYMLKRIADYQKGE